MVFLINKINVFVFPLLNHRQCLLFLFSLAETRANYRDTYFINPLPPQSPNPITEMVNS